MNEIGDQTPPAKRVKLDHSLLGGPNTVNMGMVRAKPGQGTLMSLLASPRFSDILVVAGPSGKSKEFHLHQAIVCLKSVFFDTICKERFKEGIEKKVTLPEIDHDDFNIIVVWLYDGGYELPHGDNREDKILKVHAAADFLQIPTLRAEIAEQLAFNFRVDLLKAKDEIDYFQNAPEFIEEFCEQGHLSEWEELKSAAEKAMAGFWFSAEGLKDIAEKAGSVWYGLIVDVLQEIVRTNFCGFCLLNRAKLLPPGTCRGCGTEVQFRRERVTVDGTEEVDLD